jgi:Zn finger protein HypA/HybF involved in hydrogenase expression
MPVISLNRTLDQELLALSRGASLECLACGEFVLRLGETIACPECGSRLQGGEASVGAGDVRPASIA